VDTLRDTGIGKLIKYVVEHPPTNGELLSQVISYRFFFFGARGSLPFLFLYYCWCFTRSLFFGAKGKRYRSIGERPSSQKTKWRNGEMAKWSGKEIAFSRCIVVGSEPTFSLIPHSNIDIDYEKKTQIRTGSRDSYPKPNQTKQKASPRNSEIVTNNQTYCRTQQLPKTDTWVVMYPRKRKQTLLRALLASYLKGGTACFVSESSLRTAMAKSIDTEKKKGGRVKHLILPR
jgi:hypothetical protein